MLRVSTVLRSHGKICQNNLFVIILKMRDRPIYLILRDAGHLIQIRDCPVGRGAVDSYVTCQSLSATNGNDAFVPTCRLEVDNYKLSSTLIHLTGSHIWHKCPVSHR